MRVPSAVRRTAWDGRSCHPPVSPQACFCGSCLHTAGSQPLVGICCVVTVGALCRPSCLPRLRGCSMRAERTRRNTFQHDMACSRGGLELGDSLYMRWRSLTTLPRHWHPSRCSSRLHLHVASAHSMTHEEENGLGPWSPTALWLKAVPSFEFDAVTPVVSLGMYTSDQRCMAVAEVWSVVVKQASRGKPA